MLHWTWWLLTLGLQGRIYSALLPKLRATRNHYVHDFLKLHHNCDVYMGVQKERKSRPTFFTACEHREKEAHNLFSAQCWYRSCLWIISLRESSNPVGYISYINLYFYVKKTNLLFFPVSQIFRMWHIFFKTFAIASVSVANLAVFPPISTVFLLVSGFLRLAGCLFSCLFWLKFACFWAFFADFCFADCFFQIYGTFTVSTYCKTKFRYFACTVFSGV